MNAQSKLKVLTSPQALSGVMVARIDLQLLLWIEARAKRSGVGIEVFLKTFLLEVADEWSSGSMGAFERADFIRAATFVFDSPGEIHRLRAALAEAGCKLPAVDFVPLLLNEVARKLVRGSQWERRDLESWIARQSTYSVQVLLTHGEQERLKDAAESMGISIDGFSHLALCEAACTSENVLRVDEDFSGWQFAWGFGDSCALDDFRAEAAAAGIVGEAKIRDFCRHVLFGAIEDLEGWHEVDVEWLAAGAFSNRAQRIEYLASPAYKARQERMRTTGQLGVYRTPVLSCERGAPVREKPRLIEISNLVRFHPALRQGSPLRCS